MRSPFAVRTCRLPCSPGLVPHICHSPASRSLRTRPFHRLPRPLEGRSASAALGVVRVAMAVRSPRTPTVRARTSVRFRFLMASRVPKSTPLWNTCPRSIDYPSARPVPPRTRFTRLRPPPLAPSARCRMPPPSHGHRCLCLLLTCSRSLFRRLRLPKLLSLLLQPRLRVSLCLPPVSLVVLFRFARLAHCMFGCADSVRSPSSFLQVVCGPFCGRLGPSVCCPCRPWPSPSRTAGQAPRLCVRPAG